MAQTNLTFKGTLAADAAVPVTGTVTQTSGEGGEAQTFTVAGTLTAAEAVPVTFTVDGAQAAAKPPSDVLRGFLQANAGIAAASVGIVAPLLIGLPNVRDAGLFQELRGLLFWMSVTVFVSVLAAIVLQIVRTCRYHGLRPKTLCGALTWGILVTAAPAVPGAFALHSALEAACETTVTNPADRNLPLDPASRACGPFATDVAAADAAGGGDPGAAGQAGGAEPGGEPASGARTQPIPEPASGAASSGQENEGQGNNARDEDGRPAGD